MFIRIYQFLFSRVSKLLTIPSPELISRPGALADILTSTDVNKNDKFLIVSDPMLEKLGLVKKLTDILDKENTTYTIFTNLQQNPSIKNVEDGLLEFKKSNCTSVIALGGGSPMDCAKGILARISSPNRTIRQMKGLFKVKGKTPYFIAIPTTAGTGSETTVVAVITDTDTHEKFAVNDFKLVPNLAILDAELMVGLPRGITAATGMDALTHTIEAYTNIYHGKDTEDLALKGAKLIFENLEKAYNNGSNLVARQNMSTASFYAGRAFTKDYVGYIHAIAHNLGGLYGVPHGLANAIILPHLLEHFGASIYKRLGDISDYCNLMPKDNNEKEKANNLISKIRSMNSNMGIPSTIKELKKDDIPLIVKRALKEAHPDYPVPLLFSKSEFTKIVEGLLTKE